MISGRNLLTLAIAATFTGYGLSTAMAAPVVTPGQLANCLRETNVKALNMKAIYDGLGLPRDQLLELQSRLDHFTSIRGFPGLEGIGLTPEQIAEVQRRIDVQVTAMNRYPLGYPCKPFKSPDKVIAFVKATLLDNGFRRTPMPFNRVNARQIRFTAIQDGIKFYGTVVRTGLRQVTVSLVSYQPEPGVNHLVDVGGNYPLATKFDP